MPEVPLNARVVEVIGDHGISAHPQYRYGSGCVVAGRTVLTAAHVVAGAVRVLVRDPEKVTHDAAVDPVFVGDTEGPGPDLALVQITSADVTELPPIGLAAVNRDTTSGDPIEPCHVIGYPQFMERTAPDGSEFRDIAHATGRIPVLSGLAGGLLTIEVNTAPRQLPAKQTALGDSEWAGMSGAPVITGGLLLGVVTEHAPRAGSSSITATPLTALEQDPAHSLWGQGVTDPSAWWARFGVPGVQSLRKLPDATTNALMQPVLLLARPGWLAGREKLLADLRARLSAGQIDAPRVVALCGMGGAGKTSVAVEYGYRYMAELGVVWQLPAGDKAAMAAAFRDLAELLEPDLKTGNPVAAVHAMLAARPGGWLLIFDNAPDAAAVASVLPPAGRGQVIITSQSPYWPGDQAVEIPVLDEDTAAGFLTTRTGDSDDLAARQLAREMGGLPLALEQAGAYMKAVGQDIAGYLALYEERQAQLLARGEPSGYDGRVTTTWELAFTEVQKRSPTAVGLLRLFACCAPDAIPYRLLLRSHLGLLDELPADTGPALAPLLDDPLAVDDALAALRSYSLVSQPQRGVVAVHRLVQAITLAQVPRQDAEAWRQATAVLISSALPDDPQWPANWPAYAALLPHARAAIPLGSTIMTNMATYLGNSGSYAAARDLSRELVNARQEYGATHPSTLTALGHLAYWTGLAGDVTAARDQYAALVGLFEQAFGPQHTNTLRARGNLASWTGQAGDALAARDQYATLVHLFEDALGSKHPDTLAARANLARWAGHAKDAAGARDQYATLVPLLEQASGAQNPEVLKARANLAAWTGRAGDAAAARDQYAALVPTFDQLLGPQHPDTLVIHADLGAWTGHAGDAAAARDQYAILVPIFDQVLGTDHPRTQAVHDSLAYWTSRASERMGTQT